MASILIIYTGGTIGMVESADGKTLVPFDLEHILTQVPELKKTGATLQSLSFKSPLDSSDMQPTDWVALASTIAEHHDKFDGFVILHGSDTLAYTASALSFMLAGLQKPVILTGSQLPIGSIRTDARENLITAVELAALQRNGQPLVREVAIYFEFKLYRGNRTTKVSAEAFEAFASPNYPLLAEAGVSIAVNHSALWQSASIKFSPCTTLDPSVAVLTLFPGIPPAVVEAVCGADGIKTIVLQTFGAGNAPRQPWLLNPLKQAILDGITVVNVTQCAKGRVEQGRYATSVALRDMGVVSGVDMTLEAAVAKCTWLNGNYSPAEAANLVGTNLRGELSA